MLACGKDLLAFAGKSSVYFRSLKAVSEDSSCSSDGSERGGIIDLKLSEEWRDKNAHVECISLSPDDKLVAVADSLHVLWLYERKDNLEWTLLFSRKSSKRIIKLQFTSDGQILTYLDKQGDIFAIRISSCRQQISNAKKIMGHTSFISDFVTRVESNQIISCDRDEKIRISNFPDAFVIQGFKLGHTESVMSLSVLGPYSATDSEVEPTFYLLSASVAGILMLWDLKSTVPGTETQIIKRWNLKDFLPESLREAEVKAMRVCQNGEEDVYISILIEGSTKVSIFRMTTPQLNLELIQEVETDSDLIIMEWASVSQSSSSGRKISLIVLTPQLTSLKIWQLGHASLTNEGFLELNKEMVADIKASVENLKPSFVPAKKRITSSEASSFQDIQSKKIKA